MRFVALLAFALFVASTARAQCDFARLVGEIAPDFPQPAEVSEARRRVANGIAALERIEARFRRFKAPGETHLEPYLLSVLAEVEERVLARSADPAFDREGYFRGDAGSDAVRILLERALEDFEWPEFRHGKLLRAFSLVAAGEKLPSVRARPPARSRATPPRWLADLVSAYGRLDDLRSLVDFAGEPLFAKAREYGAVGLGGRLLGRRWALESELTQLWYPSRLKQELEGYARDLAENYEPPDEFPRLWVRGPYRIDGESYFRSAPFQAFFAANPRATFAKFYDALDRLDMRSLEADSKTRDWLVQWNDVVHFPDESWAERWRPLFRMKAALHALTRLSGLLRLEWWESRRAASSQAAEAGAELPWRKFESPSETVDLVEAAADYLRYLESREPFAPIDRAVGELIALFERHPGIPSGLAREQLPPALDRAASLAPRLGAELDGIAARLATERERLEVAHAAGKARFETDATLSDSDRWLLLEDLTHRGQEIAALRRDEVHARTWARHFDELGEQATWLAHRVREGSPSQPLGRELVGQLLGWHARLGSASPARPVEPGVPFAFAPLPAPYRRLSNDSLPTDSAHLDVARFAAAAAERARYLTSSEPWRGLAPWLEARLSTVAHQADAVGAFLPVLVQARERLRALLSDLTPMEEDVRGVARRLEREAAALGAGQVALVAESPRDERRLERVTRDLEHTRLVLSGTRALWSEIEKSHARLSELVTLVDALSIQLMVPGEGGFAAPMAKETREGLSALARQLR